MNDAQDGPMSDPAGDRLAEAAAAVQANPGMGTLPPSFVVDLFGRVPPRTSPPTPPAPSPSSPPPPSPI